jgi:hypothetical protein
MSGTRIQFHGTASEIAQWAATWAAERDLNVAFEHFEPVYRVVAAEATADLAEVDLDAHRIALRLTAFRLGAQTTQQFASQNPGSFWLTPGRQSSDGLRETLMGAVTDEPDELRRWAQLIREARRRMHRGATVRSPLTGLSQRMPSHLHTPGAHVLAERGVRMLAIAGGNEFQFDDVDEPG